MNKLYSIEYLPIAKKDMIEIVKYISDYLENPSAAEKLAIEMVNAIEKLSTFPYIAHVYASIRPLKKEYRCLQVKNFTVFYYVNEQFKLITISRVIYNKRNFTNIIL